MFRRVTLLGEVAEIVELGEVTGVVETGHVCLKDSYDELLCE
jgi:hypothetical protein